MSRSRTYIMQNTKKPIKKQKTKTSPTKLSSSSLSLSLIVKKERNPVPVIHKTSPELSSGKTFLPKKEENEN